MSTDTRIGELLEEILETDRSAEEVCAENPELLGEVLERLKKLRSVEAQIDDLFPPTKTSPGFKARSAEDVASLPKIDGYEILSILGRGGMGLVYHARHLKLNRVVALKMLLAGPHASQQDHHRFIREAEAVAGLRHPNIVQIYDFGEADGQPYFTMEYVEGGSLAHKLIIARPTVRESAEMIATLAEAVFVAHQNGIIHRDLKPANVLLADHITPKITDFGVARRLDVDGGLTQTGVRVGTPMYMAPEQMSISSAAVGPAADIFALGAVLYEMLAGCPPFRGESLSETERRLKNEEPIPPSRLNTKVPRDLETICLKCLEKSPQNRYETAADLAADLNRFLRHEPIHARPISPAERSLRWIRRNPLAAALTITAVVLAGLIVSDVIQQWARAAHGRSEKSRLTARYESGVQLVKEGRFPEARAILEKLGDGGNEDLRQRIDRTLLELTLVEKLNSISVNRALAMHGHHTQPLHANDAVTAYALIFSQLGMGNVNDDPQVVAQRIGLSDIDTKLLAALDDWEVCETDDGRRRWLLEVARRADPAPSDWHAQVRDIKTWHDPEVLARLAERAPVADESVQLLRALGDRLAAAGLDSIAFRTKVQQEHPNSFLLNLSLADALRDKNPAESVRYYQAALAIRPLTASAHNNLALALAALGRIDEAIVHYQQALKLAPQSEVVHYNLGVAFSAAARLDEAIDQFEQAIQLAPSLGPAHGELGRALFSQRRYAEAEASLRRCLELLPSDDPERSGMSDLLRRCEALKAASAKASTD